MWVRGAVLCACALAVTSALGEELAPEQARAFIAGKLFAYNCFDGTSGMGRILADGSVIGTIRPPGRRELRYANLPPGTITITSSAVCAHLPGLPINPCFRVQKTDYRSFRGSISGLSFAYCDFHQRNPRSTMTRRRVARHSATAEATVRPGP